MIKHPPYVEEAAKRVEATPISGGIDTSAIDCLRQGTSIRNDRHRYCGTQPKIWAGNTNHHLQKQVFGVPGMYPDGDAYNDTNSQFSIHAAINHFASGVTSISEAFLSANNDEEIDSFDGAIEPLEIRNVVLRPGATVITKLIRSPFGEIDGVLQEKHCDGNYAEISPYIDQGSVVASFPRIIINGSGSDYPLLIKQLPEHRKSIVSFDDTRGTTRSLATNLIISGSGRSHLFSVGLLQLTGSTETSTLERRRSTTAGIVYHNTPCGTDSIAYGGLTRYRAFGDN